MKHIILLNIFIIFVYSSLIGQEHTCHSNINLERSKKIQKLLNQSNAKNYSGQSPMVRLVLHNVHRDSSFGFNRFF